MHFNQGLMTLKWKNKKREMRFLFAIHRPDEMLRICEELMAISHMAAQLRPGQTFVYICTSLSPLRHVIVI